MGVSSGSEAVCVSVGADLCVCRGGAERCLSVAAEWGVCVSVVAHGDACVVGLRAIHFGEA